MYNKCTMNDDQFTKLFKYIQDFRQDVDTRFNKVDERFDRLEQAIDSYAAQADRYFAEMAALSHKVDRLERQIQFLAKKAGVNLESL